MTDAKAVVDSMERSADKLEEYKYQCEITSKKNGKTVTEAGTFFFKKPHSIRVEVTKGPKSDSVAVVRPDGKVRGHMGGLLKFFVGTVSPNSDILVSTTGFSLVHSDYKTLATELKKYLKEGWSADLAATTGGSDYIVELKSPDDKRYKRIVIDEKTFLPVEWENKASGKLESLCKFKNVVVNPGFSPSLFKM